ncbi:MAG: glycosyltransferase family 4 protein [Methanothrix sp.]|nr:glycosyltransferase family 4 protein [Methanothrix sp.]
MDRKNKVVHLTTVHPPFDTRIFHKEAKTLVRAGYDVTLIAQHEKDVVVDGVKIIALPKPRNRLSRMFGLTWRACCLALRQRADICHLHDPELIPMGLLLRLVGKRVIYDVHEDVPKQVLSKEWIPGLLRRLVAVGARLADAVAGSVLNAVVAATPQIARRFPATKTVVVQNFPILDELLPPDPMPYTSRPLKVAYVGGITVIRGIREMVQAMALLPNTPNAKLVLAGTFTPPALEEEVRRLPGWERVEFMGWQDRSGVARVLGQVRAGLAVLQPTRNYVEGWPVKLFEYMSAGLPVVASDFPLWKEIVEGNECGITVNPLDPKEIAQAIEYLLTHPEEAQEMGQNGRQAVLEKYNWEREAAKLLKLYEELLSR